MLIDHQSFPLLSQGKAEDWGYSLGLKYILFPLMTLKLQVLIRPAGTGNFCLNDAKFTRRNILSDFQHQNVSFTLFREPFSKMKYIVRHRFGFFCS